MVPTTSKIRSELSGTIPESAETSIPLSTGSPLFPHTACVRAHLCASALAILQLRIPFPPFQVFSVLHEAGLWRGLSKCWVTDQVNQ